MPFTPKTLSFLRSLKRNNRREWFHERTRSIRAALPRADDRDRRAAHRGLPIVCARDAGRSEGVPAAAVPRHAVQRRQDAAEDAHRRDVSESRARPHERRAASISRSRRGWVWIGGGLWRPDTSQLQLVREHIVANHREFEAIVKAPALQEARRPAGRQADARAARVREGSSGRRVSAAPAVHGFSRGAGGVRDRGRISTSSCATRWRRSRRWCGSSNEPLVASQQTDRRAHILDEDSVRALAAAQEEQHGAGGERRHA